LATKPPVYFDFLIDDFLNGRSGRHVHLGYWDDPPSLLTPCKSHEFAAAQQRLTDLMIDLAKVSGSLDALDVGCGFGGMLEALSKFPAMKLTGLGNDPRQLEICRSVAHSDATLSLIEGDACALPFSSESFDRVFCVEAMFHFRSRRTFLVEAARVLRPGGRLVLSDILCRDPKNCAPIDGATIAAAIQTDYGPWPELWIEADDIVAAARESGLTPDRVLDITRQTLPTYRVTAPNPWDGTLGSASAGNLMRWLHETGGLSYLCASFLKA
jgi:MPBQ/MSBQ methyltransferase